MKYLDEYRDADAAKGFSDALKALVTRPWVLMEICGGQTHAILRFGLDELLPPEVELVHGPGCPVCVTPVEQIERAITIAKRPNVIFCSFGDMLRVPGSREDLLSAKAAGADVRVVYSPLDAAALAEKNPDREVVFFAVGFETTAPANAMAIETARQKGLKNFSVLVAHVLVPPAMDAILGSAKNRVQGFLAAGHVCTVMGWHEYEPLASKYKVPIVVTGFEPVDILHGVYLCVKQLEEGRHEVENQYTRIVKREGNPSAQELVSRVFQVSPRKWRGIGEIPASGLSLAPAYAEFDAEAKFDVSSVTADESPECMAALVLQGLMKPHECPAFGKLCTPERPLGAPMVSNEGACAAYYRYKRHEEA